MAQPRVHSAPTHMPEPDVQNNHEATTDPPPQEGGATGKGWTPGKSGNPGGRSKGIARRVREIVGPDGDLLVQFLLSALGGRLPDGVDAEGAPKYTPVAVSERLVAAKLLMERGWGKAPAFAPIEDDDPLDLGEQAQEELAAALDASLDELEERRSMKKNAA